MTSKFVLQHETEAEAIYRHMGLAAIMYCLLSIICNAGEEGTETSAAEVRAIGGARAASARGASEHPQVRDRAVLEDPAAQREGAQELRDERRPEEGAGDPRRAGHRTGRVHQRDQPVLPGGSRQVLLARIRAGPARTRH